MKELSISTASTVQLSAQVLKPRYHLNLYYLLVLNIDHTSSLSQQIVALEGGANLRINSELTFKRGGLILT